MTISVRPVHSRQDLQRFIRLPWRLYEDDKNWVPPLVSAEKKMLDRKRNPFFRHSQAEYFLATDGNRDVGRIAAIVNGNHNEFHGEKCGFFGYFESENEPEVAKSLFDAAEAWLRNEGMETSRGPANPSMNDPCGMLADGFQWPPFVMMTYNPRWYLDLVEGLGYAKVMDLNAYMLIQSEKIKQRIDRVANQVKDKGEIRIRNVNLRRFDQELDLIMKIYNDAWEKNWGFVPMTEGEIRFAAKEMKAVILPEFTYVAEFKDEPVGFALAIPDVNRMLKKVNGSLFPFGWIRFLKFFLRKIPCIRILVLGVKRDFQHMGIGTLFYQRYMEDSVAPGVKYAELSWILESNELMTRPIREMGGKPYKVYRMYEKKLVARGPSYSS